MMNPANPKFFAAKNFGQQTVLLTILRWSSSDAGHGEATSN